jgi:hypothetical protein
LLYAFEGNNNHLIIDPSPEQLFKVNSHSKWNSEWISKEHYQIDQPCPIFFRSWVSCLTQQTSKKMFQTFQPKLTHFSKRDGEASKKYLWCCWTVINYKEENNLQKAYVKNLHMFVALLENIKLEMTTKKILNILKIKLFQSWYCSHSTNLRMLGNIYKSSEMNTLGWNFNCSQ